MLYRLEDTIAAISTPPGIGGIGVVRISGPLAIAIIDKIFSPSDKKSLSNVPSHTIVHGWIKDAAITVDEVMVSAMLKPNTYTGENIIEISAHSSPLILERILKLSTDNGARLAGPGEFTFRAFVNGKLDLAKAESVADLISSKTNLALDTALSHLNGSFSLKIRGFKKELLELIGSLEAALDHSEEDIEFISKDKVISTKRKLQSEIDPIIASFNKTRFLREGLKTVIIGKPNSGKSSLLNALLEKERSIVTDIPGTTRDVIEETIDIKGFPVVLMDTAGIRAHAQDPVEIIGQNRTVEALNRAQVLVWVLDSSVDSLEADRHIYETLLKTSTGKIIIVAWNKSDLPFKADEKSILNLLSGTADTASVKISAKYGTGIQCLEDAIVSAFSFSGGLLPGAATSNARHIGVLTRTEKALKCAIESIETGHSEEIPLIHLRDALSTLGEITGETATEEILENIFKNFCVGK